MIIIIIMEFLDIYNWIDLAIKMLKWIIRSLSLSPSPFCFSSFRRVSVFCPQLGPPTVMVPGWCRFYHLVPSLASQGRDGMFFLWFQERSVENALYFILILWPQLCTEWVSPEFVCWNPTPQCDGIRGGALGRWVGSDDIMKVSWMRLAAL